MKRSEVYIRNKALKARLWKEGLYVQEVGQVGKPDYLIVSASAPSHDIKAGGKGKSNEGNHS